MTDFRIHTIESAPDDAKPLLEQAKKGMGFVPNLYAVFAESPAMLEAYATIGAIFDRTSFTAVERQIVLLTTSFENECNYCIAAHTSIAGMQHVPAEVVQALRSGEALPDARLEALRSFVREVVRQRGWVSEGDVQAFLEAGFTRAQLLEVIVGIAMKTLSNYTNHIAGTPLDRAFQANAWTAAEKVATG